MNHKRCEAVERRLNLCLFALVALCVAAYLAASKEDMETAVICVVMAMAGGGLWLLAVVVYLIVVA